MTKYLYAASLAFVACVAIGVYHRTRLVGVRQRSTMLEEQSSVQGRINSLVQKAGKKQAT